MINDLNVLAIIPARGGSKGIPGKNISSCAGKPLILWTLDAAHDSDLIDIVVTSTDSDAIEDVCDGAVILRPARLAKDETPMEPVVIHALDTMMATSGIAILLQPTSPLRTAADIDEAICLLEATRANTVASVHESWAVPFTGIDPPRRQDREPTLFLNGAIYVFRVPWFREHRRFVDPDTVPYVMPAERSVDVDYPVDLALAGLLISTRETQ